jgi:hypothetical protein
LSEIPSDADREHTLAAALDLLRRLALLNP